MDSLTQPEWVNTDKQEQLCGGVRDRPREDQVSLNGSGGGPLEGPQAKSTADDKAELRSERFDLSVI